MQKHTRKRRSFHTMVSGYQTEILHVALDSQNDADKRLDAIITSDKYIFSNLIKMSDSICTDSDDD